MHGSHAYGNDEAYDNDRHENEGDYTDYGHDMMEGTNKKMNLFL